MKGNKMDIVYHLKEQHTSDEIAKQITFFYEKGITVRLPTKEQIVFSPAGKNTVYWIDGWVLIHRLTNKRVDGKTGYCMLVRVEENLHHRTSEDINCIIATTWSDICFNSIKDWAKTKDNNKNIFSFSKSLSGKYTIILNPNLIDEGKNHVEWSTIRCDMIQKMQNWKDDPFDIVEVDYRDLDFK